MDIDDDVDYLDDLEDVPMTISVDKPRTYTRSSKDLINDLYTSNRYISKDEWRTEVSESKETVISWKPEASLIDGRANDKARNSTKISSPDAQLVHFLNYNYHHALGYRDNHDLFLRYRRLTARYALKTSSLFPKEGASSIPLLLGDGTMVYIGTRADSECTGTKGTQKRLLGRSIHDLMIHVENLDRRALKRKRKALQDEDLDAPKNPDPASNLFDDNQTENGLFKQEQRSSISSSELWVDKYSPTQFSDLLSDEKTNRDVLRAIKIWDPYVFRRSAPAQVTPYNNDKNEYKKSTRSSAISDYNKQNRLEYDYEDSMADNIPVLKSHDLRPPLDKRVILLSGPPGVGKTTMAHIIAKHAGYRAVEVNGSDERTAAVLKQHVLRAMESGLSKVPNCIILDEIDGADAQSSISTLLDIIKEEMPSRIGKGHKPFIRRPIIFICNQKYAAALRPLLPYAQQFEVAPPSFDRLISRIRAILAAEGITVGGGSTLLNQLVHATGGDIRSALFTLQFTSSRAKLLHQVGIHKNSEHVKKTRSIGLIDISTALTSTLDGTRSLKDDRSDIVATLNAIFRKPIQRGDKEIERILNMVDSFGDNSKTLDQIFNNVLEVPFVDPMFDRCWSAFEWLSYSDIIRSFKTQLAMTNNVEHFSVQNFHIPTSACAIHYLCRIEKRPILNFSSREMLEAAYQFEVHVGLIGKFVDGLTPSLQSLLMGTNLITDLIPFVLWLLSAGEGSSGLYRAVSNVDMLMKSERVTFERHCEILRSLGLNYVKDDVFDRGRSLNVVNYSLSPDISEVMKFKYMPRANVSHRNELPTAMKQLLAHAVHLEEVRHRGDMNSSSTESNINLSFKGVVSSEQRADATDYRVTKEGTKNFLGAFAAKSKAAKNAKTAAIIGIEKLNKTTQLTNTGSGIPLENVVKFKYQKGFTQAVRMPCSARDFV